jgi:hypothetical protein
MQASLQVPELNMYAVGAVHLRLMFDILNATTIALSATSAMVEPVMLETHHDV